jgi:hypothetical protein
MTVPTALAHPHSRFPRGMPLDVKLVVADEVEVTLAGFPATRRSLDVAISAYAEQLAAFVPEDVRTGFLQARRQAGAVPPSASQVRSCIAAAARKRMQHFGSSPDDSEPVPCPSDAIPDWRAILRSADHAEVQR